MNEEEKRMLSLELKDKWSILLYYDLELLPEDLRWHLRQLINNILFRTKSYQRMLQLRKETLESLQKTWGFWDNEEDRKYDNYALYGSNARA